MRYLWQQHLLKINQDSAFREFGQGDILRYVTTDHQYPSSQRNISIDVDKTEVPEE